MLRDAVYLLERCLNRLMTFSTVDWTILWKFYHLRFFWMYLIVGVPLKGLLVCHFEAGPKVKASACAVLSSFASSAVNTWFPILPIACSLTLNSLAGHAVGQITFCQSGAGRIVNGNRSRLSRWGALSHIDKRTCEKAVPVGTRREHTERVNRARDQSGSCTSASADDDRNPMRSAVSVHERTAPIWLT